MPDWTYSAGTTGTLWTWDESSIVYTYSTNDPMKRMWEIQLEEERKESAKRKQRAEDKVKYPLFFLKEGIV